jgi:hypothetical protein
LLSLVPSFAGAQTLATPSAVAASAAPSASPTAPPSASPSEPASPSPQPSATPLLPAGVVPTDVSVELGGTVSPAFALARIAATIALQAQSQGGAVPAVTGVSIPNALQPGESLEALAHVTIPGSAGYAPVAGVTAVHLAVETLGRLEPAFLLYSDDPERLGAADDGVLFRSTVAQDRPVRLYAYHVSDTPDRHVSLVLLAAAAARVQVLGYAAGPADAFAYVGHVSTLQYLLERGTQESFIVPIASGAAYVQQLGYRTLAPGELVAAIFDLRVLDGGPVEVEVIATSGADDPLAHVREAALPGDGHGRRGEFALADVPPIAFTYAAGDPEPSPFPVGVPTIANLRPGGRALGGDYGVIRSVQLELSNAGDTPREVYFYEQAAGGTATTTVWFTGDPRPTELPCVRDGANRYLVKAIALGANASSTVTGEYMTDGSSSFPLLFGVTSEPPSPPPGPYSPDACNPRPAPTGTPAPPTETPASPAETPLPAASAAAPEEGPSPAR